ncbi:MAG TPA: hypothetical protein VFC21_11125 [Bryobacteraceae bacterium]|nr:hypothetical protein [Bryobacteraceae bacterium]
MADDRATEIAEKPGMLRTLLIVLGIGAILFGVGFWLVKRNSAVQMTTPYQAVLLSNGAAYFGRLEGLGTPFPVLKEVYYVQSRQNPDTKQTVNILVKRGKEWHAPDRMILNSNMIVLVEPVNPSSRVAQLIADAKNQ